MLWRLNARWCPFYPYLSICCGDRDSSEACSRVYRRKAWDRVAAILDSLVTDLSAKREAERSRREHPMMKNKLLETL
jgi:hypothetical protein